MNNQLIDSIIFIQNITSILILLLLVVAFLRLNKLGFILAIIGNEVITILNLVQRETNHYEVHIALIKILLIPTLMVWRWNFLGIILSLVFTEAIMIISFLLNDFDSTSTEDLILIIILPLITIFPIIIISYCLFILLIKHIWFNSIRPNYKSIFRKIRRFFD